MLSSMKHVWLEAQGPVLKQKKRSTDKLVELQDDREVIDVHEHTENQEERKVDVSSTYIEAVSSPESEKQHVAKLKDVTFICLVLYVDDMVIAEEKCEIEKLELLGFEVEMKDLGASMKILRMEIFRDREKKFFLSQKAYSIEVLTRISDPLWHLARWGIWPVGVSDPLGHLVRWNILSARTSG
ncbi:hypothetical protein YC2023_109018 [Brassica napus]